MTTEQELKILIRKLMPMMKGGWYSETVSAINKFQVQSLECFVIFFIIVDSGPPLSQKLKLKGRNSFKASFQKI